MFRSWASSAQQSVGNISSQVLISSCFDTLNAEKMLQLANFLATAQLSLQEVPMFRGCTGS